MDELTLIRQLREGSSRAFDELYALYAKRLFNYIITYVKSAEETKDIVQEVFVSLWKYRTDIKDTDNLGPWLFTLAKNRLINSYKKNIHSKNYSDYVKYRSSTAISSTDSVLDFNEFLTLINRNINLLPKTQQKVIRLSRFEGMSNKEISKFLNISEQTVKNQLSLGLKQLRTSLSSVLGNILALCAFIFNLFGTFGK